MSREKQRTILRKKGAPPHLELVAVDESSKTDFGSAGGLPLPSLAPPPCAEEPNTAEPPGEVNPNTPPLHSDLRSASLPEIIGFVSETGNLPVNDIFKELTDKWKEKNPGAKNSDLAALLGIREQACSQYKTGSDGRRPPWRVTILFMALLNQELVINAAGWTLRKRRKPKKK